MMTFNLIFPTSKQAISKKAQGRKEPHAPVVHPPEKMIKKKKKKLPLCSVVNLWHPYCVLHIHLLIKKEDMLELFQNKWLHCAIKRIMQRPNRIVWHFYVRIHLQISPHIMQTKLTIPRKELHLFQTREITLHHLAFVSTAGCTCTACPAANQMLFFLFPSSGASTAPGGKRRNTAWFQRLFVRVFMSELHLYVIVPSYRERGGRDGEHKKLQGEAQVREWASQISRQSGKSWKLMQNNMFYSHYSKQLWTQMCRRTQNTLKSTIITTISTTSNDNDIIW